MKVTDFGGWDSSIHSEPEQVKRIKSGKSLDSVVKISTNMLVVQGSAPHPYCATYTKCDCADFLRRRLPCKHMYALAWRHGLIQDGEIKRSKKNVKDVMAADLAKYKRMYEDGDLLPETYVKISAALSGGK